MTRFQKLIVALLSVLVVLVAVGVIVVVNVVSAQQRQAAVEACMEAHGYTRANASYDHVDQMIKDTEVCFK